MTEIRKWKRFVDDLDYGDLDQAFQVERRDPKNAYHRHVINGFQKILADIEIARRINRQMTVGGGRLSKFNIFSRVNKKT